MNTLRLILSFGFVLALLAVDTYAQDLSEARALPEGITATGDTTEVRALTAWAEEHRYRHPNQARQVAERALTLAQALNDQQGIGESANLLGNLFFTSDLYQAEAYYTAARVAFEQINPERGLFRALINLAAIHERRGEIQQTLSLLFDALEGFEHLSDIEGQARTLDNIGNIHRKQENWEEALVYYEQALILVKTIDGSTFIVHVLNNIGITMMGQSMYESANVIFIQALEMAEQLGAKYEISFTANNYGFVLNEQGDHERALPFLFRAEELSKEFGNAILLANVYDELGKAFLGLGQYDRALNYATESLALMEETRSDPWYLMHIHQTLSQIYEAAGNDRQALNHYRQYTVVRDSIFNVEKTEIISEMQTRYEMEERQRMIERLEQEKRIQSLQRILLLGGIAGLLLVLGVLFYRYRVKQKANRLLEELDIAKSRFFANISHEFRTPLTVILGGSQDMLAGRFGKMSEKASGQLHAMLRNTRQLQNLINEVLDLNRLESGHLELRLVPGDLVRSLKHIVEDNAPLAERNGITLALRYDVESCPRLYDEEKLEKIVGNLLSNALKFTPKDGSVRVNLRCENQVEISVTDNGPSIPSEAREKVFERFAQLNDGVLHGGTGIGLALAKELTDLHGGSITLESTPEEGSTFTVWLPLERTTLPVIQERGVREALEPVNLETSSGDGHVISPLSPWERGPGGEGDHTTVLIIEDNDDVRDYVRRSLEEMYRILEAADGETGLQQARSELPDLIVSDVMLPGIDGYEVARRLKATPETECIPVVMLTARAADEDQAEGYGSGAEVYITKPFSPETLQAAVTRLLEERRRLQRRLQSDVKQVKETVPQNSPPTLADRARAVVLENLHDENFGVDELAAALGMSRRTLYRRLKAEADLSPTDLIRTLRLEHALRLLSRGAGTVSEIAYAVGFKSHAHFTQSFREHYDMLPSSALNVQPKAK